MRSQSKLISTGSYQIKNEEIEKRKVPLTYLKCFLVLAVSGDSLEVTLFGKSDKLEAAARDGMLVPEEVLLAVSRCAAGHYGCPEERNYIQIRYLYNRFCEFAGAGKDPPNRLHKYNFYSGLLQLNPLLPTILNCMFKDKETITFLDFALFLSTFQAHSLKTTEGLKNSIKEKKLKILFNMYDHNKDGRITKYDLVIVVHKLFSNLLNHVQIMRIVDTMMREMDQSDSNHVLFGDFCRAFEVFDMTERMVTWIPGLHGRSVEDSHHSFSA